MDELPLSARVKFSTDLPPVDCEDDNEDDDGPGEDGCEVQQVEDQEKQKESQINNPTTSKKKKNKKKKKKNPELEEEEGQQSKSGPSSKKPNNERLSAPSERDGLKKFWQSLNHQERLSLVTMEKSALLNKMKEQQKLSCVCQSCVKARAEIDTELETLYEMFIIECGKYQASPPLPSREKGIEGNFAYTLEAKHNSVMLAGWVLGDREDGPHFFAMLDELAMIRRQGGRDSGLRDNLRITERLQSEERIAVGKRYIQMFAARVFEKRIKAAYREKVVFEMQEKLIKEEEALLRSRAKGRQSKMATSKKGVSTNNSKNANSSKNVLRSNLDEERRLEEEAKRREAEPPDWVHEPPPLSQELGEEEGALVGFRPPSSRRREARKKKKEEAAVPKNPQHSPLPSVSPHTPSSSRGTPMPSSSPRSTVTPKLHDRASSIHQVSKTSSLGGPSENRSIPSKNTPISAVSSPPQLGPRPPTTLHESPHHGSNHSTSWGRPSAPAWQNGSPVSLLSSSKPLPPAPPPTKLLSDSHELFPPLCAPLHTESALPNSTSKISPLAKPPSRSVTSKRANAAPWATTSTRLPAGDGGMGNPPPIGAERKQPPPSLSSSNDPFLGSFLSSSLLTPFPASSDLSGTPPQNQTPNFLSTTLPHSAGNMSSTSPFFLPPFPSPFMPHSHDNSDPFYYPSAPSRDVVHDEDELINGPLETLPIDLEFMLASALDDENPLPRRSGPHEEPGFTHVETQPQSQTSSIWDPLGPSLPDSSSTLMRSNSTGWN